MSVSATRPSLFQEHEHSRQVSVHPGDCTDVRVYPRDRLAPVPTVTLSTWLEDWWNIRMRIEGDDLVLEISRDDDGPWNEVHRMPGKQ